MRDILFRGKTEDGKWVEGYLFVLGKGTEYEETYILGDLDHRETVYDVWKCAERVIPETVGQFTGLIDKNGKRIYEDDIVRLFEKYIDWVEYRYGCFTMGKQFFNCEFTYQDFSEMEVIGNTYDNPELLEGE